MTAQPGRIPGPQEGEPVEHALDPLPIGTRTVGVRLLLRRAPDGAWRGRLRFVSPGGREPETADIFCAASESELWRAVRALGTHHLRALYLSLA